MLRDEKYDCGSHNVLEIIKAHLKKHGFDGLYCTHMECGCTIDDLNPCDSSPFGCEPGYKTKNYSGEDIIGPEK